MSRGSSTGAWLTVIYKVPSKPSTIRVNVWKQVKELGGLSLQQSTYVFPDRPEVRVGLTQLQRQVEDYGGETTLLEVPSVDEAKERSFIEALGALRDEEYLEIIEDCEELAHRLARKTERDHFDRDELEDARADHARTGEHLAAIKTRDYFGSSRQAEAEEAFAKCGGILAAFAKRVTAVAGPAAKVPATPATASSEVKHLKESSKEACSMPEAVAHAHSVLDRLADGTLQLGETKIEGTQDSALLEVKYSDRNGRRCLEIEFEW